MAHLIVTVLLLATALIVALPAIVDIAALILWFRRPLSRVPVVEPLPLQPLLFLVPAHNESLLITRCVLSLREQQYPRELLTVVVMADNCSDNTAQLARAAGASVLERSSSTEKGKGHAIGWALERLPLDHYSAVVIVDADTIVEPDFSMQLMTLAPLESRAMQTFDGASNEFETWLTRMAGLFTRNRYGIALPLKSRAGLACPMTGDGIVLGTETLRRHPWRVATITEGWELYTRLTLEGVLVDYAPAARLYAQEARSMKDSGTQRQRWTSGRLAVLRMYFGQILRKPGLTLLQRLDLLAELTSLGPVVRGLMGVTGMGVTLALDPHFQPALIAMFATGIAQPMLYSAISLARHPEPGRTAIAFLRLPVYAVWRLGVGMRSVLATGQGRWVRTQRREESAAPKSR